MSGPQDKPFDIPKQLVWEAYKRVKANKGAAGVDGQSIEEFESDLRNNLYKIWNRMSSGTYFPPPVMAVEIPKPHGGAPGCLGVPTVADRIAQTVAAMALEARTESIFHDDSYGYRPRRAALDAVASLPRAVLEEGLGDRPGHPGVLRLRAMEPHGQGSPGQLTTGQQWVVLYVKRWLAAPMQQPDGTLAERDAGPRRAAYVQLNISRLMNSAGLCAALACWPW